MLDDWYSVIRLPLSSTQFQQLPRNAVYLYEYFDGQAHLTPRPKTFNALLAWSKGNLPIAKELSGVLFRPLREEDWASLPDLFVDAFAGMQPFASLSVDDRRRCALECLDQTHNGGDGPIIADSCIVAQSEDDNDLLGAMLVSLIPRRSEGQWWNGLWDEPPPSDAISTRMGRPHLTWVFVGPAHASCGIGSQLLARAVAALDKLGYTDIASTFLVGNDPSVMWHWRNGFRLLRHAASCRIE